MQTSSEQVSRLLEELRRDLAFSSQKSISEAQGMQQSKGIGRSASLRALANLLKLNRALTKREGRGVMPHLQHLATEFGPLNEVIRDQLPELWDSIDRLKASVSAANSTATTADDLRLCDFPEDVQTVLNYSHKLAYSSHAPLVDYENPYAGPFQPPMPTIAHMQFSKLQETARLRAEQEEKRLQAEKAKASRQRQQSIPLPEMPAMPAGWKPGDPIPLPPAGWRPGDPIQLDAMKASVKVSETAPPKAQVAQDIEEEPMLDLDAGIDDDFVLNAEAVASDSEDYSDDDLDDDDDD